jgi:hypothetical protein
MVPFGRGRDGAATVRVSHEKDREGYVHGIGVDDGQPDGLLVAELHVDAEIAPMTVSLRAPTDKMIHDVAEKRTKRKEEKEVEITYEMEIISDYWDEALRNPRSDPKERSQNQTVTVLRSRQASTATKYDKKLTKENLVLAIKALLDADTPGGPYAVVDDSITLKGGGHPHKNVKPYVRPANNVISMSAMAAAAGNGAVNGAVNGSTGASVSPIKPSDRK